MLHGDLFCVGLTSGKNDAVSFSVTVSRLIFNFLIATLVILKLQYDIFGADFLFLCKSDVAAYNRYRTWTFPTGWASCWHVGWVGIQLFYTHVILLFTFLLVMSIALSILFSLLSSYLSYSLVTRVGISSHLMYVSVCVFVCMFVFLFFLHYKENHLISIIFSWEPWKYVQIWNNTQIIKHNSKNGCKLVTVFPARIVLLVHSHIVSIMLQFLIESIDCNSSSVVYDYI